MVTNARGFRTDEVAGTDRKTARLAALAERQGLAGIVLSSQHNFAWLTGGRTNRVDAGRETGVAHLLASREGRRWVLAGNIEAERMVSEVLVDLAFEVVQYPWEEERADPALPVRIAAKLVGGANIGTDTTLAGGRNIEPVLAQVRSTLDPSDMSRYRELGAAAAQVVGSHARNLEPGTSESDVATGLAGALLADGMRPLVLLVGADDRLARYRHPVPTTARWHRRMVVAVCAERGGLVVALSRLVTRGADADFDARTRACAGVFASLVEATVAGATGSALYETARLAYASAGFPGEERRHHQGGAIAYRSREWLAHPASSDVVTVPQAFAWNPTITGTKVEETVLLFEDGRFEVLTHDPAWPSLEMDVRGHTLRVPLALGTDAGRH